jgi:DNA polymerase-4
MEAQGKPRRIIHLDLDAFFCAVEEIRDPGLKGKPFAVGGSPEGRGVVASCSYAARRFGVKSAMPMARALTLCPQLMVIQHHFQDYKKASRQVMDRLHATTSLVEQISIDEAFLDVSQISEPPEQIARRLQKQIQDDLGLPSSLGVATNKLIAKIATNVGKGSAQKEGPPNAITVVPPGQEASFLAPLEVEMLWGVGPRTAERLAELGIHTIGELAQYPGKELTERFGKIGWHLSQRARGIDNRPIVTHHEPKSLSSETTFPHDVRAQKELHRTIDKLSERVARRLQRGDLSAKTVKLKLRWPDFTTLTRQTTFSQPTSDQEIISRNAILLFHEVWKPNKPVRLLGVGVSNLASQPRQLGLWDEDVLKETRLHDLLADLKRRFGEQAPSKGLNE